ncbi:MAG TPA: cystatin domain-containing protein [Pyrinomonadaceae bacterium]|nr:cystatin domain-containing protein [Pyrinomonadaceae bacterium]HNU06942.1 cystatin domain-containing protein [Pyrinomonadaceae bacterium]
MKSTFRFVFLTVAMIVALGAVSVCNAQDDDDEAGGYVTARVNDANVVAAANFAVRERGRTSGTAVRLVRINSAKQQVVAGMNYELCMQVGVKSGQNQESVYFVTAVVYQDLKKVFSLTSWARENCDD